MSEIERKIVSLFDSDNIPTIGNLADSGWCLPLKTTADYNQGIVYPQKIEHNLTRGKGRRASDLTAFNALKSLLSRIEKSLSRPTPFENLQNNTGYTFPNANIQEQVGQYLQLLNKNDCEDFIKEIGTFDDNVILAAEVFSASYLLGYVGSGKSAFIDYMSAQISDHLKEEKVIYAGLSYGDVVQSIRSNEFETQAEWNGYIENLMYKRIVIGYEQFPEENIAYPSSSDDKDKAFWIIRQKSCLMIFDGFDNLSANQLETQNSIMALRAIINFLAVIKNTATNFGAPSSQHKVRALISLRKCTYEGLGAINLGAGNGVNNAYFMHAAKFEDVIGVKADIVIGDTAFWDGYKGIVLEVLLAASRRISAAFASNAMSNADMFDNNYRRRLRFVATVILVYALKLTNEFTTSDGANVNELFLQKLLDSLKDSHYKENLLRNALIYGLNRGFNNQFSSKIEHDNLGKLCGYTDNVFCYLPENFTIQNRSYKLILKLRILQILLSHLSSDGDGYEYLTQNKVVEELKKCGIESTNKEVYETLALMEKSQFSRSSKPAANAVLMHFKATNFGAIFYKKILSDYDYLSAVAQNTCLPEIFASEIKYTPKTSAERGESFHIIRPWAMNAAPYLLVFLRVLKSVENNHLPRASGYNGFVLYPQLVAKAAESLKRILASSNNPLTAADKEQIYAHCNRVLSI